MTNSSVPVLWQMPYYVSIKKLVRRYCDNAGSLYNMLDIPLSWKTIVSLYLKIDWCFCASVVTNAKLLRFQKACAPVLWQRWLSTTMTKASVPVLWQMPNYYGFQKACAPVLWQSWLSWCTFLWAQNLGIPSAGISAAVTGEKCVYGGLYLI